MTNAFRTPPSVLRLAGAAVLAVAALTSTTASASAGRTQGVYAGDRFTVIRWTQPAFTSITVETGDLAPLAAGATPDTVLHVFNAAAPSQFFAGNDDAAGLTSPYASSVGVGMPPFGAPRQLIIVVRAYSSARAGTGNLRIKTGSAVLATFPMLFEAGTSVDMGTYAAGMHALAVEEQGGQGDPLMLLQAGTADHATAFDDDAALGLTPFIHADDPCSSACKAIVGTAWTGGTGTLFGGSKTTTVFWDPDMHVAGQDIDADGLSTALENAIGTDATNDDTDQDGLKDGLEVLGGNEAEAGADWRQVRYPYFGANPKKKDMFVQADWKDCTWDSSEASKRGCRFNPDDTNEVPTRDRFRLSSDDATRIVANFAAAGVALHMDIGVSAGTVLYPVVSFNYGSWGGAKRRTDWVDDKCQFRTGPRVGAFHFFRVNGFGGGQSMEPGPCGDTSVARWDVAHEIGHNTGLDHEPLWSGPYHSNGQPNYLSIMNYPFSKERAGAPGEMWPFSDGHLNYWTINPSAFDEKTVLNAEQANILANQFKYLVGNDPASPEYRRVDWNRDGAISDDVVSGAITLTDSVGDWHSFGLNSAGVGSDFQPGSTVAWGLTDTDPASLLWFTRVNGDLVVTAGSVDSFPTAACTTCAPTWAPRPAPSGFVNLANTPGTVGFDWNGNHRVLVAATLNDGSILLSWATGDASSGWSAPITLKAAGDTSVVNSGGTAVVVEGDTAYVYVTATTSSGVRLREYTYNLSSGAIGSNVVFRADGSPVVPEHVGIGVTMGWTPANGTTGSLQNGRVLLVPELVSTPITGSVPTAYVSGLHMYAARPGYWEDLPQVPNESAHGAQPAIAFVPTKTTEPSVGRFYIAFRGSYFDKNTHQFATEAVFHMKLSEGNGDVSGPNRRFIWGTSSSRVGNEWAYGSASIALSFDPRLKNGQFIWPRLIGSRVFDAPNGLHGPMVSSYQDNILPGVVNSQSDRAILRGGLRCTLVPNTQCACRWPGDAGCE